MNFPRTAALFPGQGAFYRGALSELRLRHPQVDAVFSRVDPVAQSLLGRSVSSRIFCENPPTVEFLLKEEPDVLQAAIYAVSVSSYRILESMGFRPEVMMGHSFGEISALVCAGAFTEEQGAELVCRQVAALKNKGDRTGYMGAVGLEALKAEKLVAFLGGDRLAVAAENHPRQTVLSGAKDKMDFIRGLAPLINVSYLNLHSPYAFHSPLMKPVAEEFAAAVRHIKAAPLKVPVYSPIYGRRYTAEDVLTDCLADHLFMRVRFADGLRALHEEGIRSFIECGALDALTKMTRKTLTDPAVLAAPCLDAVKGESASLSAAVDLLASVSRDKGTPLSEALIPDVSAVAFSRFWEEKGALIRDFSRAEFDKFIGVPIPAPASVPPAPAASPAPAPAAMSRADVFREIVALYASALEYPRDVFTEDAGLESELGVDSVKQTELAGRLFEKFGLPEAPGFRLAAHETVGKLADYVASRLPVAAPAPVPSVPAASPAPAPGAMSRADVFREIVALYASALEYPRDVFTEDAGLESELGVDSVKQTELAGRLFEKFGLPEASGFRLAAHETVGKLADYVVSRLAVPASR